MKKSTLMLWIAILVTLGSSEARGTKTEELSAGKVTVEVYSTTESSVIDPNAEGGEDQYAIFTIDFGITTGNNDLILFSNSDLKFSVTGSKFSGDLWIELFRRGRELARPWIVFLPKESTTKFRLKAYVDPSKDGFYGLKLRSVRFFNGLSEDRQVVVVSSGKDGKTDRVFIPNQ